MGTQVLCAQDSVELAWPLQCVARKICSLRAGGVSGWWGEGASITHSRNVSTRLAAVLVALVASAQHVGEHNAVCGAGAIPVLGDIHTGGGGSGSKRGKSGQSKEGAHFEGCE